MARLRAALTPEEGERFRQLGHLCAEAIHATAHSIRPGQTEHEMTGRLAWEAERRGVQAIVNVVATDERVALFRHPPPTDAKLQHYAMLVLCGQRGGLICSVTRFVYFGRLPIDLRRKAEAAARVASSLIAATQPGQHLAVIFQQAMTAFAEVGFPEAWRYHHLGGAAGYEPREYFALPTSRDVVSLGQAYTWNPAIEETRSVDTILVTETGADILTAIPGWPVIPIEDHARLVLRPAILEIR
jgi:antitoxin VapB